MSEYKKAQGLAWKGAAIGNAEWTGVRLRVCVCCSKQITSLIIFWRSLQDVLISAGIDPTDDRIKHIQFTGADSDPEGRRCVYISNVLFFSWKCIRCIDHIWKGHVTRSHYRIWDERCTDSTRSRISITTDSTRYRYASFLLNRLCAGIVGARQVKWLTGVYPAADESASHWQQRDYRVFAPSIESGANLDFSRVPSIQEVPVQSAICTPTNGSSIDAGKCL